MNYFDKVIKVADTFVEENDPKKLHWSWGPALAMFTLSLLDDELGEKRYFNYYKEYTDFHYDKGVVVDQSDTCAPALIANELYKKTKEEKYLELTNKGIDYLLIEPRLIGNLINHNGHSKDSRDYPKSIWVDSIMMSGVFSVIAATDHNNNNLLEFSKTQPKEITLLLQDKNTKLFHHSWWKILKRVYPKNLFWGRGNGWVIAAFSMFLDYVEDPFTKKALEEISNELLTYQREDYYFDTVLNKKDNYRESSATALISYGWLNGVNKGYLSEKYLIPAQKAFEHICEDIRIDNDDYYMTEISKWTIPMFIAPYKLKWGPYPGYKYVKTGENIPYGVASLILAGIAYNKSKNMLK